MFETRQVFFFSIFLKVRIDFQDPCPQSFFFGTSLEQEKQVHKCFVIMLMFNAGRECRSSSRHDDEATIIPLARIAGTTKTPFALA
jgi:hypothetical protein